MCVITEEDVERLFIPGDQLPRFWEGEEVLGVNSKDKDAHNSSRAQDLSMAVDA